MKKNDNPFKGLKPFQYEDRDEYYGYLEIAQQLRLLVCEKSISMLTAPSGVGKSSFINAAFKPVLEKFTPIDYPIKWNIISMEPKNEPIPNLLRALRLDSKLNSNLFENDFNEFSDEFLDEFTFSDFIFPSNTQKKSLNNETLLIVDQFEQIFPNNNISRQFIHILLLLKNFSSFKILLVMRVDYLIDCASNNSLIESINDNIVYLPVFPPKDLEYIIKLKVKRGDLKIKTDFTELLIKKAKEVRNSDNLQNNNLSRRDSVEDDSLGLLQYYLYQLWNRFSDHTEEFATEHYLQLGPLSKIIDRTCDDVYYFSKPQQNLTQGEDVPNGRQERHMTKFLFQYISKQDKSNPKKIVRNPKSINQLCTLYNSIYHSDIPKLFDLPTNDIKTTEEHWEKLVAKYDVEKSPEIGILRIIKEKEFGKEAEQVDVIHETVFRQWFRCNKWIGEKNETFEEFNRLIKNEKKREFQKRLIPFDNLLDYWDNLGFFESQLWREQYFEYSQGTSVKIGKDQNQKDYVKSDLFNFDHKYLILYLKEENIYQKAVDRVYRLRYYHAIKRADFYSLLYINHFNSKYANHSIDLSSEELEHPEFDKEFYFALNPERDPGKELLRKDNSKSETDSFNEAALAQNEDFERDTVTDYGTIVLRWVKRSIRTRDLSRKSYSSPTNSGSHTHLYEFAAFAGNIEYLVALMLYVYKDKNPQKRAEEKEVQSFIDENIKDNQWKFHKEKGKEEDPGIYSLTNEISAFSSAVFGGHLSYAKKLFDFLSEEDQRKTLLMKSPHRGNTVFHYASNSANNDLLEYLLSMSKSFIGSNKRSHASNKKSSEDLKVLEKRKLKLSDPLSSLRDKWGYLPIHNMAFPLPQKKSNINLDYFETTYLKETKDGYTPFFLACALKNKNLISKLLDFAEKKGTINKMLRFNVKSNFQYKNYLFGLVQENLKSIGPYGQTNKLIYELFEHLLNEYKMVRGQLNNVNSSYYNLSLLHYCGFWLSFDIIKLLLEKGADPNKLSNVHTPDFPDHSYLSGQRYSPLDYAVLRDDENILRLFFSGSVKKPVKPTTLKKAAELAYQIKKFELFEYLNQQGERTKEFTFAYNKLEYSYNEKDGLERLNCNTIFSQVKNWGAAPPLFGELEKWSPSDEIEFRDIIGANSESIVNMTFKSEVVLLASRTTPLPFYKNHKLIEVLTEYKSSIGKKKNRSLLTYILDKNKNVVNLDGTSPPIHGLNKKLELNLTKSKIDDYLKFFCSAVHGEEGAFKIVDSMDSIHWIDNSERDKTSKIVSFILDTYWKREPKQIQRDNKKCFSKTALVNYSNALFLADFIVFKNGYIEMEDDIPLVANMYIKSEVFDYGLRSIRNPRRNKNMKMDIMNEYQAAKNGVLELMEYLINENKDFDINDTILDEDGNVISTLIHNAVESGKPEIVRKVLDYKPNTTIKTKEDRTPREVAENKEKSSTGKNRFKEIIVILDAYKSQIK